MITVRHSSDCAVHNLPATPPGPCDCGADVGNRIVQLVGKLKHLSERGSVIIDGKMYEIPPEVSEWLGEQIEGLTAGSTRGRAAG